MGAEKVNKPQGEAVPAMTPEMNDQNGRRLESTLTFLYLRAKNGDFFFFFNKELILLNG